MASTNGTMQDYLESMKISEVINTPKNRNKILYRFVSACARSASDYDPEVFISMYLLESSLPEKEIRATVKSATKRYRKDFDYTQI